MSKASFIRIRTAWHLAGLCLLLAIAFITTASAYAASSVVTLTEQSEPAGLLITLRPSPQTNYQGEPLILLQTVTAPPTPGGYHFTHWTLNDLRIEDVTGQSLNPAPVNFTNNITAIAHYVAITNYANDSIIPDWYKIVYFNTTNIQDSFDANGDGFNLGTEYVR